MSGCSLHDAFPDNVQQSGKTARKEERRKAQTCKGPALAFLKGAEAPDPDRPTEKPYPPPEKLKGSDDFTDIIGQPSKNSPAAAASSSAPAPVKKDSYGNKISNYFGKSETDEAFADYSKSINDNPGYNLQPDFLASFGAVGLDKSAGKAVLDTPSLNDAWKPLTPNGSQTSYFTQLTAPRGGGEKWGDQGQNSFNTDDKNALLKKIDILFARLEELESKRNDHAHTEMTLFILSGLFLIFGLDTIRKLR
jgi:hypothetical protein